MKFGKASTENSVARAMITIVDVKKAYSGRPWCMARGMLRTANTFSAGTIHSQGCAVRFAVAEGTCSQVAIDTITYSEAKARKIGVMAPLTRACKASSVFKYK